ncbi:MAG: pitrilysin family protein, partial [Thermoanaerobaculia bacterium]|nr:pitrilysin family protein [Thermoanaerobaculia bacterium]
MSPLDRSRPPVPGRAADFSFPGFLHTRLDSGMEVYVLRRTGTPLVGMRMVLPAGAQHDPAARPGLAAFTAALMAEGTRARSSQEVADRIEGLGGSLGSTASWNSATVSVAALSSHLETAFSLLAEVVTSPGFLPQELERKRRERLAEWLRRRDQPAALAEECFAAGVYAGTPYDHPLLGTRASLEAIDGGEIGTFWADHAGARGTRLLVAGDVDADAVLSLAEAMPALPASSSPPPPPIDPPAPRRQVRIVDRPAAAQTELRVGHVGPPRRHPDRVVLRVANSLLGGKFTSRINLNLRERHGYTYGAHSSFVDRQGPGPFLVWTAVANDVAGAAAREILNEMARLQDEDASTSELEETRDYLRGVFPYGLQTNGGLLGRLQELAVYALPDDHFDRQLEGIAEV